MRIDARAVDSDEESSRRTKRMRVQSPPQRTSQPYLDPPAAALRHADLPRKPSIVPRASSAVLPSSRTTLSPRRHLPVTRTMSIDPPHHPLVRRESTAFNFGAPPSSAESDYDMAIDTFRDVSMPPSPRSPRPSFRMRSSVTPQPQQYQPPKRYISEPPPLNTLVSNPVFLHAPVPPIQPSVAPTLGALVESVRAVSWIFFSLHQQSNSLKKKKRQNLLHANNTAHFFWVPLPLVLRIKTVS
jgi:nucleoporin NUP1